ncbi:hypothetical protein V3C99_013177 [Haemonchus contortus]|uniref:G protein-coupled receptor n=1 Tax=Haemonchus contortus TaxID=6289 RepID=A0A7I4Y313_HAECO
MNKFVYTYINLCKQNLHYIYESSAGWTIIALINVAIIVNWVAMLYISCRPTESLIQHSTYYMVSVYNINPADHALFGLSMELASPVEFAFFIESLVLVMFLGSIGITCAIGMDQFLKKNSMSPQTKKVHRRTFIMLSCQTLSPTILLYAPLCSVYLLVFAGIRSPMDMTCAITFLMSSFPIFSPIIIISFMKDYRDFILVTLRLKKASSSNQTKVSHDTRSSQMHK